MRRLLSRVVMRWVHLGFAGLIGCYVYWPEFRASEAGALLVQAVVMPALTLSGVFLWKGKAILRAVRGRAAIAAATAPAARV